MQLTETNLVSTTGPTLSLHDALRNGPLSPNARRPPKEAHLSQSISHPNLPASFRRRSKPPRRTFALPKRDGASRGSGPIHAPWSKLKMSLVPARTVARRASKRTHRLRCRSNSAASEQLRSHTPPLETTGHPPTPRPPNPTPRPNAITTPTHAPPPH